MGVRITFTDPPSRDGQRVYKVRCFDCGAWFTHHKVKKVVKALAKHRKKEHGQK
jgi:hypothetical protein